jgi:hypothetical protein
MSETTSPEILSYNPRNFREVQWFLKPRIVFLKRKVNLRESKMALLPYRQGVKASHVWTSFIQIKLTDENVFTEYQQHSMITVIQLLKARKQVPKWKRL